MEHLVTSREISEKLAKAGVRQESVFYWLTDSEDKNYARLGRKVDADNWELGEVFSAYLAGELGEMLPKSIERKVLFISREQLDKNYWGWYVSYYDDVAKAQVDRSLAEALGLILLWLIENGYMEVKR